MFVHLIQVQDKSALDWDSLVMDAVIGDRQGCLEALTNAAGWLKVKTKVKIQIYLVGMLNAMMCDIKLVWLEVFTIGQNRIERAGEDLFVLHHSLFPLYMELMVYVHFQILSCL